MEFYDFPVSWEFHHPNWRTHFFQRGGSTTNQWTNKKGPTFLGYFCRTSSFGKINLNQKLGFCQVFKIHHVKVPLMIGFYRELYYLGYLGLLLPIAGKPPPRWQQLGPAWTRWSSPSGFRQRSMAPNWMLRVCFPIETVGWSSWAPTVELCGTYFDDLIPWFHSSSPSLPLTINQVLSWDWDRGIFSASNEVNVEWGDRAS